MVVMVTDGPDRQPWGDSLSVLAFARREFKPEAFSSEGDYQFHHLSKRTTLIVGSISREPRSCSQLRSRALSSIRSVTVHEGRSNLSTLAEGEGLEPPRPLRDGSFQDCCHTIRRTLHDHICFLFSVSCFRHVFIQDRLNPNAGRQFFPTRGSSLEGTPSGQDCCHTIRRTLHDLQRMR